MIDLMRVLVVFGWAIACACCLAEFVRRFRYADHSGALCGRVAIITIAACLALWCIGR